MLFQGFHNNLYFKDLFESKPGYFLYRPANKELRIKHMKLFNKQENMPTDIFWQVLVRIMIHPKI
jgi:hypothetical protein